MRYWECILNTPEETIDARCDELAALGVGGFVIENEEDFHRFLEQNRQYWDYVDDTLEAQYAGVSRLKFYLADDEEGKAILSAVRAVYPSLILKSVADSDWENNWRSYYQPIEVGNRLVVVPEWESVPDGSRLPLRLDPGLIFGTGSHATTRMCLEALESWAAPGRRVLDLGCGSGILGIGALLLGCSSCLGVDIDPKAPDVAAANAALNGFGEEKIRFLAGDILNDAGLRARFGREYDLILSNIVADVILSLAPLISPLLSENGVWISSGVIEGRQDEVRRAIRDAGFRIVGERSEEDWYCFTSVPAASGR